jgi:hypothetical protein
MQVTLSSWRSPMKYSTFLGAVAVMASCFPGLILAETPSGARIPKTLASAIKKAAPNATILRANQVDRKGCRPVPANPGLVEVDLNGDGHVDAAVLLVTPLANEGEPAKVEILFVFFVGDSRGGYIARTLKTFKDSIPVGSVISIRRPGKIRPRAASSDIFLPNGGIILTFCEQSEAVYAFVGDQIQVVPIAD